MCAAERAAASDALGSGSHGQMEDAASPFWDGFGESQIVRDGSEKMQLLRQIQPELHDEARGKPSRDTDDDEWERLLQSEWVIEVKGQKVTNAVNRLSTVRRPGDFRVASIVVSET